MTQKQRTKVWCSRCRTGKNARSIDALRDWNIDFKDGRIVEIVCPRCQTPEEGLEGAVNSALVDYRAMTRDGDGNYWAGPKVVRDDD